MVRKDKTFICYKKYILKCAKNKYPVIRKRRFSPEYYLNNFILLLDDVNKWKSLKLVYKNNGNDNAKFHWKSIYNEYNKWLPYVLLFLKEENNTGNPPLEGAKMAYLKMHLIIS